MADPKALKGEARGDWLRTIVVLSGLVAILGTMGTVLWLHSAPEAASSAATRTTSATTSLTPRATAPSPTPPDGDPVHVDIYFDFKSTRLRADAVSLLQKQAALVKPGEPWAVLVQGHADLRGPVEYNRRLAQRRAEAVRQFLVELGVPETSIKVVTLGQDGTVCDDPGQECQQLNRRVHLEMRKLPRTAAALSPVRVELVDDDDHDCPGDADDLDADAASALSK